MKSITSVLVLACFFLASCGEITQAQRDAQANRLVAQLTAPAPSVDGTAIMLVIDTSGSMDSHVKNASGADEIKLNIAKRCATQFVDKIKKFGEEHPDKKISLGICAFSSSTFIVVEPKLLSEPTEYYERINKLRSGGGTAIGDAMVFAKQKLDATGLSQKHILVITDGENGNGEDPAAVVAALAKVPADRAAATYLIGFDVGANTFNTVKDAGSLVLSANNEAELLNTTNFVLGTKILVEKPE